MKQLFIKLLFRLLRVQDHTKHIIVFEDLLKLKPKEGPEVIEKVKFKHTKALSSVSAIPGFIEWLYLQVVIKQREHIQTMDKEKKRHQVASILFILYLINEVQQADEVLKRYNNAVRRKS